MNTPVVLITGALTGIGRATAQVFARKGANVVISGRRQEAGVQLKAELNAFGGQTEFVLADVRNEDEVSALVAAVVKRFGRLDVAVNNAGFEGVSGPATETTVDNYEKTFDTNVLGTLLSLKHELAVMIPQGSGSIVNLSSVAGHIGMAGMSLYAASKHAVEGLTRSAALEAAGANVRINAVAPGAVQTEMLERVTGGNDAAKQGFLGMIPAKRFARPEEIAQAIAFLASNGASYINGQILDIDGGFAV